MDLIGDLGTDVAVAILVERKMSDRLDEREAKTLICRVNSALGKLSESIGRPGKDRVEHGPADFKTFKAV